MAELSTLTVDDVLNQNLLQEVFHIPYIKPKPLTATIYHIPISTSFIHNQIVQVISNPLGIHCKWRPQKYVGVRRLFNILFDKYPITNEFVPISHTSVDVINVKKDFCLLRQRCAAHVDDCTTRYYPYLI